MSRNVLAVSTRTPRRISQICRLVLLVSLTARAVPPPAGIAPVNVPSGGFSIDGNVVANSLVGDWVAGSGGAGVLNSNGTPINPSTTFHFVDAFNTTSDNTFAGGLKWTDDPNTWQWTTSKASSKVDINNVLLHVTQDALGHTWLVVAADRLSTSGDSYIDFEFLQNPLVATNSGKFVSTGPNGGRTVNDILLSLAFTSGGSVPDFFAWRWVNNGTGFAYVDSTASMPTGRVFVAANTTTVPVPFGAFGQTSYAANAFAEAAIDLTALLGAFDPCLSIGVKTVMVKTKTSASSTATIVDFINPIQYNLHIGPSANAGPNQTVCSQGSTTDFALQGQATPGLQPIASTSWSVVAGSATIDSPSLLATTAHVSSQTATLRLTVVQNNGCTETNDVLLTVVPLPSSFITGPTNVCPQSVVQFSGPAGMARYSWSVTGNGVITGATNSQTVSVKAGSACGTGYALSLNVANNNNCVSSCTTNVLVSDSAPPIINAPANLVLECPAVTSTNATGVATAQDNCGSVTVGYSDAVTSNCGNSKVIARTWVATDLCGNIATALQTITVQDTKPPTITAPANVVLECPANTSTNATGMATAQDGCSAVTISYSDMVSNSCGGAKVIARTWTATDGCGNSASALQTITLRDTKAPTLIVPANLVLECPADTTTNSTGLATAQDACSTVTVSYSDVVSNNCGGSKLIKRTWTATDACGNSTNALQTITVRDTTPPSVTPPPNLVLECPAITTTNVTGVATAQDGCSSVTLSYSDVVSNSCGGSKTIARTWTVVDGCGNSASALQTITVRDTTPPTVTAPPSLVLECPATTTTNVTGVATAQDTCSAVTISYSDVVSNSCGGSKTIARTWTATDACGNSASALQTITVRDTTPPTIKAPTNLVLECPAITTTNATGVATAQDTCSAVTISYSDAVSNSCGGSKTIARTWTATDACGNSASALQTITVRDTAAPTITAPANLVLECPATTTTNATGVATAQDSCSAVTVSYSDVVSNSCGGGKTIARTWTATDACGNSASALQTITVRDTTPPTITAPANLVLECPANTTTNATGVAITHDGCSAVTLSYSDIVSNSCGGSKTIARTWTATDACGNSASALQTITVRDTTPPTVTPPPNVVLECPAVTTTNVTGVATAQDGCSAVTSITFSDVVSNGCGGGKTIARTWTAVDSCGNTASALQTITVRDTTPPAITAPANLVLECPAITTTNVTGVATAQDGCSAVTISYSDLVSNICGGAKLIARTWTATDACGNKASALQTITIHDTTPPTITAPPNLVLQCPADTRTNATGMPTAQDGCGVVNITYTDAVSNSCGGSKVITRLWTAADGCGNSASAVQTITTFDTTPPSLTLPANVVQECPGDTRTNITGMPIAVDGCSSVALTYSDTVSNSCGSTRTVWRLWTATDACGNTTNGLQTIVVRDTTPPTLVCPNISVQCPGDVPAPYTNLAAFVAAGGRASDSCNSTLTFSQISDSGLVGKCPGKVTRVYQVVDACGNYTQATQTITVQDTIAPVITCPTNVTVECGISLDPANTGTALATDNCSTNVTLNYTDSYVDSSTYGLKFYAADPGSNSGPYAPTYTKLAPVNLPPPSEALVTGRAADPLRNAVAFGPTAATLDALMTVNGDPMCFGQVVPFEIVINVGGGPGPEHGTIDFTADWSTYTTANQPFGYDKKYMVYAAFVDYADPGSIDPNNNARVQSYTSKIVNPGTPTEAIEGTFRISGLDSGDQVVVEVWMVLMPAPSFNIGGTVAAGLIGAQKDTVPPQLISTGTQTTGIGNLNKIGALPAPQQQPPLGPLPPQPTVPPGILVSLINRTWTATDDCGNQSTCVQQITVRDSAPPVLTLPPDVVLNCPADTSTNNTGTASTLDACGSSSITYSDTVSNGCGGTRMIARLWTAIDFSGNTTNAIQTITVRPTPTVTAPPDLVLECPADTSTTSTGVATAQGSCSAVTSITYSDVVSNACGGSKTIARTWTATDACGNSASALQTITLRDTTPPSLTVVAARSIASGQAWSFDQPVANDACSSVTVTILSTVTNIVSSNTMVATRTWQATDACGNTSTAKQAVTAQFVAPVVPSVTIAPSPCATVGCGITGSLTANAAGSGPLSYQWQFNGQNIPGATSNVLSFCPAQYTNAGLYCVVVSNTVGTASAMTLVNVAPVLISQRQGNNWVLTWTGPFVLQAAPTVTGPYTDVVGATSPYKPDPTQAAQKFFRLRSGGFRLFMNRPPGGNPAVGVAGPPGFNFVFQASTNFVDWVDLQTNTMPSTFVDSNAWRFPQRFYRVRGAD